MRSELRKRRMSTNSWMLAGHAVRRLFLQRPCRNESLAYAGAIKRTSVQYTIQNRANNETCFAHYIEDVNLSQFCAKLHSNMCKTQIKCAKHYAKLGSKLNNIQDMCNIVQNSTTLKLQ